MALRIEDYALIGDTHTAALVGNNGSIDWLCLPRFDSPACLAGLLGDDENGFWQIHPQGTIRRTTRRYRGDSLILETTFETDDGAITLIDFMPWRDHGRRADLVRLVRGDRGRVPVEMRLALRFAYGRSMPWVRRARHGMRAISGPDAIDLSTSAPLHGENYHTVARFTVEKGDCVPFTMVWRPSNTRRSIAADPLRALQDTEDRWHRWSARYAATGPYRDAVTRSLITLKGLTYSPTGGIAAAVTTSLPERIGGQRNWDYRYCWLRDATFTLYALLSSGFTEEAQAWRGWLLRAIAGNARDIQVLYGLAGERSVRESELPWLGGYEGSKPVRVGNMAVSQLQLDVIGEVMDAIHTCSRAGILATRDEWALQRELLRFLEESWQLPDEGLWEVRGGPRHFTHSRVMAWVAFDRAIKAVERFGKKGPVDRWKALRQQIHDEVCEKGFNRQIGAFVQSYGSKHLDASLLMIPLVGFLPASDPRVASTLEAIGHDLMTPDGLVRRYDTESGADGLPAGEGAFLACSFWYADNLHLAGRTAEAKAMFERLLGCRNDVGLLAEEWDPVDRRQLGNFPQAFSHVALVNTAHNVGGIASPASVRARA